MFINFEFSSFRRPNPIPILAPPDHKKNQAAADENTDNEKGTSSAENIDHILDNMFVQRQPYEPTISLKDSQAASAGDEKCDEQLNDGMNVSQRLEVNYDGKFHWVFLWFSGDDCERW